MDMDLSTDAAAGEFDDGVWIEFMERLGRDSNNLVHHRHHQDRHDQQDHQQQLRDDAVLGLVERHIEVNCAAAPQPEASDLETELPDFEAELVDLEAELLDLEPQPMPMQPQPQPQLQVVQPPPPIPLQCQPQLGAIGQQTVAVAPVQGLGVWEALVSSLTTMPTVSNLAWVVSFVHPRSPLARFPNSHTLLLYEVTACRPPSSSAPASAPPPLIVQLDQDADVSWTKLVRDDRSGQTFMMRKTAFQVPRTTHDRRIFAAVLVHLPTGAQVYLGGFSIVSNEAQREATYRLIDLNFPCPDHRRLVLNFRHHPPKDLHFQNNKGRRQKSVKHPDGLFRPYELDQAVRMSFEPGRQQRLPEIVFLHNFLTEHNINAEEMPRHLKIHFY